MIFAAIADWAENSEFPVDFMCTEPEVSRSGCHAWGSRPVGPARNHLLAVAQTNGITARRVDKVIDIVGMRDVADKRVGGFSLDMGQRLGVASALLGNPQTVVLDEPVNGLDPEGVRWIRTMLKRPRSGQAHRLRLLPLDERNGPNRNPSGRHRQGPADRRHHRRRVRRPRLEPFRHRPHPGNGPTPDLLVGPDITVTTNIGQPDVLGVDDQTAEHIGTIAWQNQKPIFELTVQQASLEEAFMTLINDSVEYRSTEIAAAQIIARR